MHDNPEDYFIGSMVVFKGGNQRFGVVDGQQRLTTITILLAVIRNALAEHKFQDLAEGIQGLIERKNIDTYRNKKINKKHLEDALLAIEKFHFLFTAVTSQRSSGGISAMYASLARRLYEAVEMREALELIKELKAKLRDRIPSLEEVKALFPEIVYTDNITKQRSLVKYILARFHRQILSAFAVDYETMTIEHLVSQSYIGTGGFGGSYWPARQPNSHLGRTQCKTEQ